SGRVSQSMAGAAAVDRGRAVESGAVLQGGGQSGLEALERLVLLSPALQRVVLRAHARAVEPLIAPLRPRTVAIVGGGLFPRTALIVRRLVPEAHITIIDASRANLERARTMLRGAPVAFVHD